MNLFELKNAWLQVLDLSDQLDEETLQDTLQAIEEPAKDKLENIYKVIRHVESDIDMIDKEQKRMAEIKKSKQNTITRLKDMSLELVKTIGEDTKSGGKKVSFDSPYIKSMYTQKSPPAVNVLNADLVPQEYLVPQPPKIDAKAIATAWKQEPEKAIAGVEITQKEGIRFK